MREALAPFAARDALAADTSTRAAEIIAAALIEVLDAARQVARRSWMPPPPPEVVDLIRAITRYDGGER